MTTAPTLQARSNPGTQQSFAAPNQATSRRWTHKTKTGCRTCRTRHLKCDEYKPACARCTATGRQCEGIGYGSKATITTTAKNVWQPSYAPTPVYANSSPQEKQSFYVFRTETAGIIAGGFDHEFWSVHVPRATQNYPAIWHASLAIAAISNLHAEYGLVHSSSSLYTFAIRQYNKAIRELVRIANLQDPDPENQETLLFGSILLSGLCSLQGDINGAVLHARSGVSLYYQWRLWEKQHEVNTSQRVLSVPSLVGLFNTIEVQHSLSEPPQMQWYTEMSPSRYNMSPRVYQNVDQAYFEHQQIINDLVKTLRLQVSQHVKQPDVVHPEPDPRLPYRNQFLVWKTKFQQLQESPYIQAPEVWGLEILKLYSYATEILLYIDPTEAELGWDKYITTWTRIVEMSKKLLQHEQQPPASASTDKHQIAAICFSPVAYVPLHGVASVCREGKLRREAIDILRNRALSEAGIQYLPMASMLEALMHHEESYAARNIDNRCECKQDVFICGDHRVIYRHLHQIGPGKGKLTLTTVVNLRNNEPGTDVMVEW